MCKKPWFWIFVLLISQLLYHLTNSPLWTEDLPYLRQPRVVSSTETRIPGRSNSSPLAVGDLKGEILAWQEKTYLCLMWFYPNIWTWLVSNFAQTTLFFFYKNKIYKNIQVKILTQTKNIWELQKLLVLEFDFCPNKKPRDWFYSPVL